MSDVVSARMKRTWDSLARRNSMHYIATDKDDWEVETFLQVGKQRLSAILRRMAATAGSFTQASV